MATNDHPKFYGRPSVVTDPTNYDTVLKWFVMGDVVAEASTPVPLSYGMRALTNALTHSMEDAARSIAMGDCDYCENVHLVEAPAPGGRTQQVYCPECNPTGRSTPFADAPIIGPKVKEGFERG